MANIGNSRATAAEQAAAGSSTRQSQRPFKVVMVLVEAASRGNNPIVIPTAPIVTHSPLALLEALTANGVIEANSSSIAIDRLRLQIGAPLALATLYVITANTRERGNHPETTVEEIHSNWELEVKCPKAFANNPQTSAV